MADKSVLDMVREMETGVDVGRSVEISRPSEAQQAESLSAIEGSAGVPFAQRVREMEGLREQGIHTTTPIEADTSNRQQYLDQELQKAEPGAHLGEPGFDEFWTRADLGFSDTFLEKRTKFLDYHPDGDFIEVPEPPQAPGRTSLGRGGKTILLRRNESEDFIELDAGVLEKFELLGDIADASADLPAAALQAYFTAGGSIAAQLLSIAAGRIAGDGVKEIMEALRGYQLQSSGELAGQFAVKTGTDVLGAGATTIISGPLNFARGATLLRLKPGAKEAQAAARELGMKPLLPHQTVSNPIAQKIGQQSQATVATINDYLHTNEQAAVYALSGLRDENALKIALGGEHMARLHDEAIVQIQSAIKSPRATLTEGGEALQAGIDEYDALARTIVNRAYEKARLEEEPVFDLAPALAVARNIRSGMRAVGKSAGETVRLDPPDKEVLGQAETLLKLNPALPPTKMPDGRVVTATDQLNMVRSNLWALKQVGIAADGPARARAAQANQLFAAVDHVLKDPKNANQTFIKAWRAAQAEAKKRFDTLEMKIIVKASETETAAEMAWRLTKPRQVNNLQVLKEMLLTQPPKGVKFQGAERWAAFQAAVRADFIAPENISGLTQRIAALDQPTADLLLSRQDKRMLTFIGHQVDRLNAAKLKETVRKEGDLANIVKGLIRNGDAGGVREFIKVVDRLPVSDNRRRIVRAGIVEDLYNSVLVPSQGGNVIDGKLLKASIKRLEDTGVSKLLTREDRQVIARFNDVALFLRGRTDAGTSLQAAEVAADIRGLKATAFQTMLETIGTGRFMTSRVGQRILLGPKGGAKGIAAWDMGSLRVMGAVLAQETLGPDGSTPDEDLPSED